MDHLALHIDRVDFDTTRVAEGFSAGGIIYVTIGDSIFPGDQWYDKVYTDLKTWLPNLLSFGNRHTDSCILQFMDGPCQIKLVRHVDDTVWVQAVWNHQVEISSTNIDFTGFIESVLKCVRKYERLLFEIDLPVQFDKEILQLRELLKTLRN